MTNLIPNADFQPAIAGWDTPETRRQALRGRGMDVIKVDKEQLIETLKRNRDEHQEIFDKAQIAYREQMVAELDRALEEARNGGKIKRSFTLPVPENHVDDFNTAIAMLEWDKGKTVKLSMREFQTYVENNWGWQQAFAANTASYVAQ